MRIAQCPRPLAHFKYSRNPLAPSATSAVGTVTTLRSKLYPDDASYRMPDDILEKYILQHIETSPIR